MRTVIFLAAILFIPFVPALAFSATIVVPDDYRTIQEAIDAAVNGDTVLVKPGTYVENITFNKNIELVSEAGPATTVIDCNSGDVGIHITSGASGSGTILDGFTITNCGPGTHSAGSAVYCGTLSPTVRNNIIRDNNYTYWLHSGGGISATGGSPEIYHNVIRDNATPGWGGGIYLTGGNAQVWSNVITGNSAANGGGIAVNFWADSTITNNLIQGNDASTAGGGLTVVDNSTATVANTILWNNASPKGKEIHLNGMFSPVTVTISYSDVDGGQLSVDEDGYATLNWGTGMIDADPLFVDSANSDHHLTYTSPCKDTGDNSAVTEITDFEGDPRIAYGTVDMGADEFHTHLYYTGNAVAGGSVELKFVDVPGTTPVGFWIAFNVLGTPIPGAFGDWWLLPPMLGLYTLPPIPSEGVLSLAGALPPSPPGPYTLYLQAIMGTPLKLTNLCRMDVQ